MAGVKVTGITEFMAILKLWQKIHFGLLLNHLQYFILELRGFIERDSVRKQETSYEFIVIAQA